MREDEYLRNITIQLEDIMQECNSLVIATICSRLKEIGRLSQEDAVKIANMTRTQDLKKIEAIMEEASGLSAKEIEKAFDKASRYNDAVMARFYEARKKKAKKESLDLIKSRAIETAKDGIINLSETTAFVIDGKVSSVTATYRRAVNAGIYGLQQGIVDYNTAIRAIVYQMASSGLRKTDYDSGYTRRIDSAARMNLLDGMRQMNMEYRQEQGRQFGADGIEISVHGMCAPDHLPIQGRQFSNRDFEILQNSLERPIGTCNCYHSIFPIVLGVSMPAYTDSELDQINDDSNEIVEYTDRRGEVHKCSKYESTQLQRRIETEIRKAKDIQYAYAAAGDEEMAKKYKNIVKKKMKYYKNVSEQVDLRVKRNRLIV